MCAGPGLPGGTGGSGCSADTTIYTVIISLFVNHASVTFLRCQVVLRKSRLGTAQEGQDYLAAMACAANYAWVNRASMTFLCRQAFAKTFGRSPAELDMHLVYDVSHNIAKA